MALPSSSSRKFIIVGAVAGGASCGARLRRLDEAASIIIFEKGPDPSFANCGMPYHIGGEIADRSKLNVQTPASLRARLNLDVRVLSEVTGIDTAAKTVTVSEVETGKVYTESYDELVLSLGAKPLLPPIPGIERAGNLTLRSLEDMDRIISWMEGAETGGTKATSAVIAGGGFIGLEMAEQLKRHGLDVTIVEALPQLLAPVDPETASQLQHRFEERGVKVILNSPIQGFEPRSDASARGSDVLLGDGVRLSADMVIIGLGIRADSPLAKAAGIELGARGAIVVDGQLRTSAPNVWAIGDAIEVANPILGGQWMVALAGPANREGRLCAHNICAGQNGHGPAREYKGTYGASALRCFGLSVAWVGVNERALQMANVEYGQVHVHSSSHASYYPGACTVSLKLLFRMGGGADDGKILGAQAVAEDGADKAIDTISTALQAGRTVRDLVDIELCYCPQLGSAKTPVNMVAMVAENVLDGLVATAQWSELPALGADEAVTLLDVRSADEVAAAPLHDNARNIPIEELRGRLGELPADGSLIVTSCKAGQRSYYAARVLLQSGFSHVKYLDGSLLTAAASPLPTAAK